jgi:methylenetetrahydrofolate reductase (NADPH)
MEIFHQIINRPGHHLSFEFFPPKDDDLNRLYETMKQFNRYHPDYYSITWGAGGKTVRKSLEVAEAIKNRIGVTCVAHFTGLGMTKKTVDELLMELRKRNVHNILVLRGDIPHSMDKDKAFHDGFQYAGELVKYIRSHAANAQDKLGILVAGSPEGHPEATSFDEDMNHLAYKVKQGAEGIVTQFFFDNACFYRFADAMHQRGVKVPVAVGVMIVTRSVMIKKMLQLSPNCTVPHELSDAIARYDNDDIAMEAFGVDFATRQIKDLLDHKVLRFHFYTMNHFGPTSKVLENLKGEFGRD